MALKPDRFEEFVDTNFFMNEVAEQGVLVVYDTSSTGVGAMLDDVNAAVKLPDVENGSGEYPAGILVGDVVNKDLTQTHLNQHKRESQIGGKVGLLREMEVTTNMISGTPGPGLPAYFTVGGLLTTVATNSTRVGTWKGGKDADGYAKLLVNIV